jgi:enamine deaminase RidA (YjgF/YER057c/UK114 family)
MRRFRDRQTETSMSIARRLADLGVTLPDAPAPQANYVPFVRSGDLVFVSGQISADTDGPILGRLGDGLSTADGAVAARACAISLLTQVRAACDGDIERLAQVVKLTGFVNSTPGFTEQPQVVNGASDFLVEVLGDRGRHSRSAVSAASLPFGVAVEIEGIFRVE